MSPLLSLFFPFQFFALPVRVVPVWLDGPAVETMTDIDEEEEFTAMDGEESDDAYGC